MVKRQRPDPRPMGADELADEIGDKRENGYKYRRGLLVAVDIRCQVSRQGVPSVPTGHRNRRAQLLQISDVQIYAETPWKEGVPREVASPKERLCRNQEARKPWS